MKLPGIGRPRGAIVSLSLDKKAVILDANVKNFNPLLWHQVRFN